MIKATRFAVAVSAALLYPAAAQWLNYPDAGHPTDGKPNLSAPAPRTSDGMSDLSGLWRVKQATADETDKAMQSVKTQPWAQELSKKTQGRTRPGKA